MLKPSKRGSGFLALIAALAVAATLGPGSCGSSQESGNTGGSCTSDDECTTGHCQSGVCCLSECGACESCALPGRIGVCTTVSDGTVCGDYTCAAGACRSSCTAQADCASTAFCVSTGKCEAKKAKGTSCSAAAECASGFCPSADKVCCNLACAADCETCSMSSAIGTCSPKAAGTACGKGLSCSDDSSGSYVVSTQCDGKVGSCQSSSTSCGSYECDSSGSTPVCKTSCEKHSDCSTGVCDLFQTFGKKGTCASSANICYADAKTCPSKGAGTKASPYCKIQDCLDEKTEYVAVADGTYKEALTTSADVELVSTGTSTTTGSTPKVLLTSTAAGTAALYNLNYQLGVFGFDISPSGGGSGSLVTTLASSSISMSLEMKACSIHDAKSGVGIAAMGVGTISLDDVKVSGGTDAIYIAGVTAKLSHVTAKNSDGHGLYFMSGSSARLSVVDSEFSKNNVGIRADGSGASVSSVEISIDRTRTQQNTDTGLYLASTKYALVTNILSTGNDYGLYSYDVEDESGSSGSIINSTFADNTTSGLSCGSSSGPTVLNSIVWKSSAITSSIYDCKCLYCDIKVPTGTTCVPPCDYDIFSDPQFDSTSTEPYSLKSTSPCVDAGHDSYMSGIKVDLLGNTRSVDKVSGGSVVDIGAIELQ
jgi:hypothetical protein